MKLRDQGVKLSDQGMLQRDDQAYQRGDFMQNKQFVRVFC